MEHDGASLGCACHDEVSGPLTCNMGILHLEGGEVTATLDMRCPVSADLDALEAAARAHLPGFTFTDVEKKPAHHVPADSELVSSLLAAYHEETGLEPMAMATGGGTYAKVLEDNLKATDITAMALAMDNDMTMVCFGLDEENSIVRVVRGESIGTTVKNNF